MMPLDGRIDELAMLGEGAQSRLFVLSHQAAIVVNVGAEYGRELCVPSRPPPRDNLSFHQGCHIMLCRLSGVGRLLIAPMLAMPDGAFFPVPNLLSYEVLPRYYDGMETTRLSSKGQVILPKSIRDAHRWQRGTEFMVEDTAVGVLLRPAKPFPPTRI